MLSVLFSLGGLVVGVCGFGIIATRLGLFVHEVYLAIMAFDTSIHAIARGGDQVVFEGLSERVKRRLAHGQLALRWGFVLLAVGFGLQTIGLVLRLVQETATHA